MQPDETFSDDFLFPMSLHLVFFLILSFNTASFSRPHAAGRDISDDCLFPMSLHLVFFLTLSFNIASFSRPCSRTRRLFARTSFLSLHLVFKLCHLILRPFLVLAAGRDVLGRLPVPDVVPSIVHLVPGERWRVLRGRDAQAQHLHPLQPQSGIFLQSSFLFLFY